jgi:hypothetical protein
MYDLLLSRYHNIEFVMHMDLADGLKLYAKAREKRQEERLYQAWVSLYPHFSKDNFISWEEYSNRHNTIRLPESRKSAEQLIAEAADIRRQIEGR